MFWSPSSSHSKSLEIGKNKNFIVNKIPIPPFSLRSPKQQVPSAILSTSRAPQDMRPGHQQSPINGTRHSLSLSLKCFVLSRVRALTWSHPASRHNAQPGHLEEVRACQLCQQQTPERVRLGNCFRPERPGVLASRECGHSRHKHKQSGARSPAVRYGWRGRACPDLQSDIMSHHVTEQTISNCFGWIPVTASGPAARWDSVWWNFLLSDRVNVQDTIQSRIRKYLLSQFRKNISPYHGGVEPRLAGLCRGRLH